MTLKDSKNLAELKQDNPLPPRNISREKLDTFELKEAQPEKGKDQLEKKVIGPKEEKRGIAVIKEQFRKRPVSGLIKVKSVLPPKSRTLAEIESILEEDLQDAYLMMEPKLQQEFKTKGEEIAVKIEKTMQETKIKVKKVFKLILKWLKIVPGVNRFFIRQEAKIKTDKIIKLKQNK